MNPLKWVAVKTAYLAPAALAEQMSQQFREAWPRLDCHYDDFIRTTEPRHRAAVQELLQRCYDAGDIELDTLIMGIGQGPNPVVTQSTEGLELNRWGNIVVDDETQMTSIPGVFAGGDIVTGAATVILAAGANGTSGLLNRRKWRRFIPYLIPAWFVFISLVLTTRFNERNLDLGRTPEVAAMRMQLEKVVGGNTTVDSPTGR